MIGHQLKLGISSRRVGRNWLIKCSSGTWSHKYGLWRGTEGKEAQIFPSALQRAGMQTWCIKDGKQLKRLKTRWSTGKCSHQLHSSTILDKINGNQFQILFFKWKIKQWILYFKNGLESFHTLFIHVKTQNYISHA